MFRILTLTITSALVVGLAVGCGSDSKKTGDPDGMPTSRPATSSTAGAEQVHASLRIPAGEDFGAGLTLASLDDFAEVMESPADYDRPVLIKAEVMDVCKAKGCWVKITDGSHTARVKFKDYGFFLPKDCEGKTVWIEGVVEKKTISVDELRHYAAESGTEDPNDITEPQTQVGFVASGVRLSDSGS